MLTHLAGNLLGGTCVGLGLGAAGALLFDFLPPATQATLAAWVAALLASLYGAAEVGVVKLPRPQSHWQVPKRWSMRFPPGVTGLLYGLGLGSGVATRLHFATLYAVLAWAFLAGQPVASGLAMAAFGLGRVLPLLLIGTGPASDGDRLERTVRTIEMWEPVARFGNGLALSGFGAYLGISLIAGATAV
jgi:cytochrome c biogenesis protein CcdA